MHFFLGALRVRPAVILKKLEQEIFGVQPIFKKDSWGLFSVRMSFYKQQMNTETDFILNLDGFVYLADLTLTWCMA